MTIFAEVVSPKEGKVSAKALRREHRWPIKEQRKQCGRAKQVVGKEVLEEARR